MLIELCVIFFAILNRRNLSLVSWPFNPVAGRSQVLERGRQGRQEAAGNRYGLLLQTGIVAKFEKLLPFFNGLRLTTYSARLWPSLDFILQISSNKSGAQVLQVGFKLWSVAKPAPKGIPNMWCILNRQINAWVRCLKPNGHKALIGQFKKDRVLRIPLVANFATNHSLKPAWRTWAPLFSEEIWWM